MPIGRDSTARRSHGAACTWVDVRPSPALRRERAEPFADYRWRPLPSLIVSPRPRTPFSRAAGGVEPLRELGLEAAVGRLVEALALHLGRQQRLVGDSARLVVRVPVALAAAERLRAGIVRVAQVVGRQLRAVLADLGRRREIAIVDAFDFGASAR